MGKKFQNSKTFAKFLFFKKTGDFSFTNIFSFQCSNKVLLKVADFSDWMLKNGQTSEL